MIIDSAKYTCAAGHDVNEDSCLCRGDKGIFIVADGLGGHSSGEKASGAAISFFENNCQGNYTEERLTALMEGANTQVLKYGDGGKTTVAAAFIENGSFIYANAGDSRVYYFHDGKIIAQTKDHSVCQASADMGMIRPEDIRGNEDRSRLLKVLGGEEKLAIKKHYQPVGIQNGDAFLICSDGFWEYVYETEMEADLLKSSTAEEWLKYMLKRHILRAQNKGDNYTAVCGIIHLEEGESFSNAPAAGKKGTGTAGKLPLLPIIIGAAAVLIAAAILICVLLFGGKDNGEEPDVSDSVSDTPGVSDTLETTPTLPEITTADTTTASSETEDGDPDDPNGGDDENGDGDDGENSDNSGENGGENDDGNGDENNGDNGDGNGDENSSDNGDENGGGNDGENGGNGDGNGDENSGENADNGDENDGENGDNGIGGGLHLPNQP